jgi:hypothetical protein
LKEMQLSVSIIIAIFLALVVFYLALFRPWQLRWGATDIEITRSMSGDDIVSKPTFNATRTVTINAPAENIFPWIVQIGVNRAGWYSYDLLDNLGRHSAEAILPQHQSINVDDLVPMSPDGKQGLWVIDFRYSEWVLWWDKTGDTSWVWGIYPEESSCSRLVTRVRVKYRWFSSAILFNLIIEFFDIWMMRKCMLGIKRRAEALSTPQPSAA